jgi:pyroglutamyl-peptidase
LGLAASRDEVSVERVAININDARIADNAGAQPIDEPVIAGAPAAYFSTLPIKAIVAALRDADLPATVSQTAGTYVCNHVLFALMHRLRRRPAVRAGFIHLPPLLPAGAGLTLDRQVLAVRLALATALGQPHDLRESGGALD